MNISSGPHPTETILVRIVSAYMDCDPAMADFYLYRFFQNHGLRALQKLNAFLLRAIAEELSAENVKATLEYDLADGSTVLQTEKEDLCLS
jgi:hypothetical protein